MVRQPRDAGDQHTTAAPLVRATQGPGTRGGVQLTVAGAALASAPPGIELSTASTAARKSCRRLDRGSGDASTCRSRGPERGCLPRSLHDDGPDAAKCHDWTSQGRWSRWSTRSPTGERQRHFQLPCGITALHPSGPRGRSRRGYKPYECEHGGPSHSSTSCAELWSSSGDGL